MTMFHISQTTNIPPDHKQNTTTNIPLINKSNWSVSVWSNVILVLRITSPGSLTPENKCRESCLQLTHLSLKTRPPHDLILLSYLKTIPSENGSRLSTSSSSASPPRVIIWYISFRYSLIVPNPFMNMSSRCLRMSSRLLRCEFRRSVSSSYSATLER